MSRLNFDPEVIPSRMENTMLLTPFFELCGDRIEPGLLKTIRTFIYTPRNTPKRNVNAKLYTIKQSMFTERVTTG